MRSGEECIWTQFLGVTGHGLDVPTVFVEGLMARTGVPVAEIDLVGAERTEGSDACLGLTREGEAWAEAITPGRRIGLRAGYRAYVLQIDEDGDGIRLEE